MEAVPGDFDDAALWAVVEEKRTANDMTWARLNREVGWAALATVNRMRERGNPGCHAVLPFIQWVGRSPESFTFGADDGELLPDPSPGRWRWYWDILELRAALDSRRTAREMTWQEVAAEMRTDPESIEHLQRTRYGTTMNLAMRAALWLERSAASFMWEHDGRGLPWSPRRV